ncbi:hypothetical protein [Muricoccus nepalensis]|uniref:hypothetical protein n=1 Tax=Muricoccus nepalensis TaxID=1854500 RepID=UPI001F4FCB08|nr:hypothetical protein [Roseomonas nepalensis]
MSAKKLLGLVGASVMHGNGAAAERRGRDQLKPSRDGQSTLVEGLSATSDPGENKELVLVDQIQSI